MIAERGDLTVYEVIDYRKEESDLAFGTTIMSPGKVGDEFFLTRGHFHVRRECGEAYYTQSGTGVLLLESRDGEMRTVEMKPGVCAFIPPDWAHRSINTGSRQADLHLVLRDRRGPRIWRDRRDAACAG